MSNKAEYCRNCGKKRGAFEVFALPDLCVECDSGQPIGNNYDTRTGISVHTLTCTSCETLVMLPMRVDRLYEVMCVSCKKIASIVSPGNGIPCIVDLVKKVFGSVHEEWATKQCMCKRCRERRITEVPKLEAKARDTQFFGFAGLLLEDMFKVEGRFAIDFTEVDETACERYRLFFAQRAYDLVEHAVDAIDNEQDCYGARLSCEGMLSAIPDMTKWPEELR